MLESSADSCRWPTFPQVFNFINHSWQSVAMGWMVSEIYAEYNDDRPLNYKFYVVTAASATFYTGSVISRLWRLYKIDQSMGAIAEPLALSMSSLAGALYTWINTEADTDKQMKIFTITNLSVAMPLGISLIIYRKKKEKDAQEQIPLLPFN